MAVILACGAVTTETPTLVPVRGCRRVTEALLVSGGGGGEAVGVGDGVGELMAAAEACEGTGLEPVGVL
jgi:hypothetical protein